MEYTTFGYRGVMDASIFKEAGVAESAGPSGLTANHTVFNKSVFARGSV